MVQDNPCDRYRWYRTLNVSHSYSAVSLQSVLKLFDHSGVGKCPILGILDITKNSSHLVDHIPNGI